MGFRGNLWLNDRQKMGVGLCSAGAIMLVVGCILLFNRPILSLGNFTFIAGLICIIGPQKTGSFFFRRSKWRGTVSFIIGMILIMLRHTLVGMAVEFLGFLSLFGDFFPYLLMFGRKMPVIGSILSLPYFSAICDRVCGSRLPI